jgi:hypothetical protein
MTQRHKSFSTRRPETKPVTFDLEGTGIDSKSWKESFEAIPQVPGASLLDFIADADSNQGGRASQAVIDFLEGCVIDEDKERFRELIRDPKRVIHIDDIADVCEWLVEVYTDDTPTEPPASRAAPRSRSGRGSTATARSRA